MATTDKLITPKAILSYPNLFKPRVSKEYPDAVPTYTADLLFSSNADLTAIKKRIQEVKIETWGSKDKWPKGIRSPFKDGNEKANNPEYKDKIYFTATSQRPVKVFDVDKSEVLGDDGTVYAGCVVAASVVVYAYNTKGNKGVSIGLRGLKKLADGKQFGGGKLASADDFDSVDDSGSDDEDTDSESLDDMV